MNEPRLASWGRPIGCVDRPLFLAVIYKSLILHRSHPTTIQENDQAMARKRLSPKEVAELLSQYRSERRRLMYQLETVREAMRELKAINGDTSAEDDDKPAKRGPGRPRKEGAATTRKYRRKPGRRKKRTIKNGGYRLNEIDTVVVDAITKKGQLLPKEDLRNHLISWARKNEPAMKEPEIDLALTRSLQKLSGKCGVLKTYRSGLRRGYHYGLAEWFFASTGKLRKQHLDRLVLSTD
jgi:hypothetical protein